MRCPNCNKFVPYDTDVEPEEQDSKIEGTDFTAEFRRVLTCEECSEELKEATIDLVYDFTDEIVEPEGVKTCDACIAGMTDGGTKTCEACGGSTKIYPDEHGGPHTHEFEIDSCDVEATTGTRGKGRRPTMLYGVSCHVEVVCDCGATAAFDVSNDIEASGMDELT